MTPAEYRSLIAETANRLLQLYSDAGVQPSTEVAMASALVFVTAAKHAGVTKDACLEAVGDAYDHAEAYLKGEQAPGVAERTSYILLKRSSDREGKRASDQTSGLGWTYVQTFLNRDTARNAVAMLVEKGGTETDYMIKEVPIG